MARKSKSASKSPAKPAPAPSAPVANVETNAALGAFRKAASEWQTSSVGVVASAAVVLLVAHYAKRGAAEFADTVERLKRETAQRGIKAAQVFKYVGLARVVALAVNRDKRALKDVLACEEPAEAIESVKGFANAKTLDALGAKFGVYQRTAAKRGSKRTRTAKRGEARAAAVAASNAAAIALWLKMSPPAFIVSEAVKAGHDVGKLAEACVPLFTDVDATGSVIRALSERASHIKSALKEQARRAKEVPPPVAAPELARAA